MILDTASTWLAAFSTGATMMMVLVTWIKTIAFQGWCGSKGRERSNCYNKDEAVDPVCRLVSDWIQGIFISSIILIILIKDHVWHQADEKKAGWHQLSAANSGSWGRSCQGCQVATFTIMEILAIVTVVIIKCQSFIIIYYFHDWQGDLYAVKHNFHCRGLVKVNSEHCFSQNESISQNLCRKNEIF